MSEQRPGPPSQRADDVADTSAPVDWEAFIAALSEQPNVKRACQLVGVSRKVAYARRHKHAEFAEAWASAEQEAVDDLIASVFARAGSGWRPKDCEKCSASGELADGARCSDCRGRGYDALRDRPSDDLAKFLLRCHRPEVYREIATLNVQAQHRIVLELDGLDVRPVDEATPMGDSSET
jgi:hypothetical protein